MAAHGSVAPRVLIVPGLYGSGPEHWQSQWERQHAGFSRVEQVEWSTPDCRDWITALDAAVRSETDNVILVGHSLGSVTIAHWAFHYGRKISGALLVAPSDTEAARFPAGTTGFTPIPIQPLPFPSTVIASTDDPFLSFERATELARMWGSELVSIGAKGHINVASGFGPWPEGLRYLAELNSGAGSGV